MASRFGMVVTAELRRVARVGRREDIEAVRTQLVAKYVAGQWCLPGRQDLILQPSFRTGLSPRFCQEQSIVLKLSWGTETAYASKMLP